MSAPVSATSENNASAAPSKSQTSKSSMAKGRQSKVMGRIHPTYDHYIGFKDGTVYNRHTGRTLKCSRNAAGYRRMGLGKAFGKKELLCHRFIWECFHPLLGKQDQVDHINRDRGDNRLINLQQLTTAEHAKKTSASRQPRERLQPLAAVPGERWMPIQNTGWRVSDKGRLEKVDGTITIGRLGAYGYRVAKIGKKDYRVHRLVAKAFLSQQPDQATVVDHVDRNKENNQADNLRWATHSENRANQADTSKAVYGWLDGHKHVFSSITEASKSTGCCRPWIRRQLNQTLATQRLWRFSMADGLCKAVHLPSGDIKLFASKRAAQRGTGVSINTICAHTNGKLKKMRSAWIFHM